MTCWSRHRRRTWDASRCLTVFPEVIKQSSAGRASCRENRFSIVHESAGPTGSDIWTRVAPSRKARHCSDSRKAILGADGIFSNDNQTDRDQKTTFPSYRLLCATSTANSRKAEEMRNCLTDEGRPLGVGLQEAPNHLRRLWPKATVVNAEGKGSDVTGSGDGQEEDRKGTTAEVSKVFRR